MMRVIGSGLRALSLAAACVLCLGCPTGLGSGSGGSDSSGDRGGGDEYYSDECPTAPELHGYALALHEEALERFNFGSSWEMSVRHAYTKPPYLTRTDIISGGYGGTGGSRQSYSGTYQLRDETTYRFDIGGPAPEPASCSWVTAILQAYDYDQQAARRFLESDYTWDAMRTAEGSGLYGLPVMGEGDYEATHEGSWWHEWHTWCLGYVPDSFPTTCVFDHPCSFHPHESRAPWGTGVVDTTTEARLQLTWWESGEPVLISLEMENAEFTPDISALTTEYTSLNDITWENLVADEGCVNTPYCEGTSSRQELCFSGGPAYPAGVAREAAIEFRPGVQAYVKEGSVPPAWRSLLEVTLTCVSGCECTTDADCDDWNICTRNSCVDGNCRTVVDDTIVPPQVPDDCRWCENGRIVSTREQAMEACRELRGEVIRDCAATGPDWLVSWMEHYAGVEAQYHYCEGGVGYAEDFFNTCEGAATCSEGTPVTGPSGAVDLQCRNSETGQELQFLCAVDCTSCQ